MNNLKNRTILVAGGAGFLGNKLCDLILREKGNLCIADQDKKKMKNVYLSLKSKYHSSKIQTIHLDASSEKSIKLCIKNCVSNFGNIYGLVNATFGSTSKKLNDLTARDFNIANSINLTGSFLLAREAANKMLSGGSIVMYGSMYGIVSPKFSTYPKTINPNPIEYGAGKAGLIQMTKYLASHYGPKNIRVNALAPGPFPNLKKKNNKNSEFLNNLCNSNMLGRVGKAHEVAEPTIFLLSDSSSYITGHTLNVDGGWTAW